MIKGSGAHLIVGGFQAVKSLTGRGEAWWMLAMLQMTLLSRCGSLLLALPLTFFLTCMADAQATEYRQVFAPPSSDLSIHPVAQNGHLYGRSLGRARWHVAQWNNPSGDIGDFVVGSAKNASLSVQATTTPTPTINISQFADTLSCSNNGVPLEFDGLIGTNTIANNPQLPSAENAPPVTLEKYESLVQTIDLQAPSAKLIAKAAPCPVSKAVSIVSVVLTNTKVSSTFFLQVVLYSFNTVAHDVWWARGQHNGRFGYNFALPSSARPWHQGEMRQFKIDLLPTIKFLVQQNPFGMDKNLSDWKISGAYFGNAVYGHVKIATEWSDYKLEGVW